MMLRERITESVINATLKFEGGYYTRDGTNTNFGVAWEYNKDILREHGINGPEDMKDKMTESIAIGVHKKYHYESCAGYFAGYPNLEFQIHDFGLNEGPQDAKEAIQIMLNTAAGLYEGMVGYLKVDGIVGPKTKERIEFILEDFKGREKVLLGIYVGLRKIHYADKVFRQIVKGEVSSDYATDLLVSWLKRCDFRL